MSEARVNWRHRLPRAAPLRRDEALLEAAAGKRVVHVGFVDERLLERRVEGGDWLHERLAGVASSIVGLDVSENGVRWAREAGYEAHAVDAQSPEAVAALGLEPAEVVVAGEVIEHLDAPGPFLRAMHTVTAPGGRLVVTTPNAYRALNFLVPLSGSELVHPDHTAWHSPYTLRNLVERNGWRVERSAYYQNDLDPIPDDGIARALQLHAANGVRRLAGLVGRRAPYWSDGLIVWCVREDT